MRKPRVNNKIRSNEVQLITHEGENIGVVPIGEAINRAQEVGLDLIEIAPNVKPPVCKIIDYGKYKYELQKKASQAKKKQKIINLKEIKLRPRTDTHDYNFKSIGEHYKAEIIDSIPPKEEISIYFHGKWHDLCRGPHLPSLGKIGKAFKLMKVAGAYWRGDSKNQMLQRIYGTCWRKKKELDLYLERISEAEKRDHRKIGKSMDLFHFQEESPGAVFWHKKGWNLFQSLITFIRETQINAGYQEVNTPEILDKSLWEKSGHWEKFKDYMYTTETPT